MRTDVSYQRPVKATLIVRLENGEEWPAEEKDLKEFGLERWGAVYHRFDTYMRTTLTKAGLIDGDITDAHLNSLRYLVEVAANYPDLLTHPEMEPYHQALVRVERSLQQLSEDMPRCPECRDRLHVGDPIQTSKDGDEYHVVCFPGGRPD